MQRFFVALFFLAAFFINTVQTARAQLQTGTSIVYALAPNQFTVAADSRRNSPETGGHDDTQCKISSFGPLFVFSTSGYVEKVNRWNAHVVARRIWQTESAHETSAATLVTTVAEKWINIMELNYREEDVVPTVRKHMPANAEPVIASAVFVATDKSGNLAGRVVDIYFDLQSFDSTATIRFLPHNNRMSETWGALGLTEIAVEFVQGTTPRATEYMGWFTPQISNFNSGRQNAELASKFVELSILLHPRNRELGFPIDVLQLNAGTGVHWISRKANCSAN